MCIDKINILTALIDRCFKWVNWGLNKTSNVKVGQAYYFEEVNKKVFIKLNGDGVVVCSFDFYVKNPNKIVDFIRYIDITDAKKTSVFPSFKTMQRKSGFCWFSDYKFSYMSENDIISSVEECYEDISQIMVYKKQNNNKCLGVKFNIDKSKLKKNNKYRITYAYSVPGLYPVKNGRHDKSEYPKKSYGEHCSGISVKHMSKTLRFAIYFENGFQFELTPMAYAITLNSKKEISNSVCEMRNNVFYTKYLYILKSPEKFSDISIKWKLK